MDAIAANLFLAFWKILTLSHMFLNAKLDFDAGSGCAGD